MSDISDKLEKKADLLFRNIIGWQNNALKRIGRRVKSIGSLSYADLQAINNASIVNQDVNAILDELAAVTKQNASEVQRIYAQMIEAQHLENRPLYDYRRKPFIPFADNKQLQAIARAYARTTNETMVNLSMTRARQLGFIDSSGNFVPVEKNFKDVIDKAVMSVTAGTGDFNSEMRDVLKELGGSGLRVDYGGGFARRLDSMVRQNLLWGAKQASVEYSEMIGEELECDGIEIDWHSNPRPSHEFMQGKQYSLHGKRTIDGVTYESADSALEALNDYGCLHFKTPIICGVSVPRFDDDELARLNAENAREIEIDGVKKTGYGWKQTMRRLETEARRTHEQITLLKAFGDKEGVRQLRDKLRAIEDNYYNVADRAQMKAQPQRMAVGKVKNYKNLLQNDGEIIEVDKAVSGVNIPPLHPWCRSTTIAVLDDDITSKLKRRAKDPETGEDMIVPADMTYEQWKESLVDNSKKDGIINYRGLSAQIGGNDVPKHEKPKLLKTLDIKDKKAIFAELEGFEKEAITKNIETAIVITKEGKVYQCYGTKDRVFPDYDLEEELRGATVSHNHLINETSFTFSRDDLDLFVKYELEILRGCDEKYTYEFTKNASQIDFEPDDWMNFENFGHADMIRRAKDSGIGYRRWLNE